MKKWIQKAIVQKSISYLPYNYKINYFFQKFVTNGVHLTDEYFTARLQHARDHLNNYQRITGKNIPESCLELGTGWYPIVPVALYLAGGNTIFSVDIRFLITKQNLISTLKQFLRFHDNGFLQSYLKVVPDRIEILKQIVHNPLNYNLQGILRLINLNFIVSNTFPLNIPDKSIELISSNNTLEHIYPNTLIKILEEFKRIAQTKGGIMSHFIDMTDHFAHFDKSISIYNFLKFSEIQWSWLDNSLQPQNRLRISDYKAIYAGLDIHITDETIREGEIETLLSLPINKKFANMSPREVAVSHCHFTSDMSRIR